MTPEERIEIIQFVLDEQDEAKLGCVLNLIREWKEGVPQGQVEEEDGPQLFTFWDLFEEICDDRGVLSAEDFAQFRETSMGRGFLKAWREKARGYCQNRILHEVQEVDQKQRGMRYTKEDAAKIRPFLTTWMDREEEKFRREREEWR